MTTVAQLYLNDKDLNIRWSNVKENLEDELKKETQKALQNLMERGMEIQVQDLIGSAKWQHNHQRPAYRHGYRHRSLLTELGHISRIKVPRISSGKIKFNCFKEYKQRSNNVDAMILKMFLAGVSTRRVKEVLEPLFGPNIISASSVSQIAKCLNKQVDKYHRRQLSDNYPYLIADGVYFNVKNPVFKNRRCVLVLYGINSNGIRELIGFQLAPHGESQTAWEIFLNRMYRNGLEGKNTRLIIRDGHKGLKNALSTLFPFVKQQHCWAHKLRNVGNKLSKSLHDACINQARDIYNAPSYTEAVKTYKNWTETWNPVSPNAVKCLNADISDLLNFFNEPKHLRIKLRTSNIIERCFREVRRRTRPMSCFNNQDSVQRIIYSIFYRQNKLWESNPLKLQHIS